MVLFILINVGTWEDALTAVFICLTEKVTNPYRFMTDYMHVESACFFCLPSVMPRHHIILALKASLWFQRGKKQVYDLGIRLRNEYDEFLTDYYLPDQVYVLSSYAERCHMSAQLLLAGLYPPKNEQIWSPELSWQPIPVHENPRNLDKVGASAGKLGHP